MTKVAAPDLRPFLEPTPRCVEVVEAELLGIRLRADEAAHDQAIQLLEKSTRTFPKDPRLAFLLVGERDALRKPDAAALATLVERFPAETFPYARLSLETPDTPEGHAEARALLERGLSRAPNSILLNFLLAGLLQRDEQWDASVAPAALATAGLLETQSYHHGWAPGLSLLNSAIAQRAQRLPDHQGMIDFVRGAADLATLDKGFISDHGCFSDPQRAALRPIWYRPESVAEVLKLAESPGSRVPASRSSADPD